MKLFNVLANTAAIASLVSIGSEAGEMGVRNASQASKTSVAIKDIKDLTGDSMLNKSSEKYNTMKALVRKSNFTTGLSKISGATGGFLVGAGSGMQDNIVPMAFSILTLAVKNKTLKTIGLIGTGLSTAWNFIKNGTNLFTRKDIIEK